MRILVLGAGAREHALVWALSRDSTRHLLICAPGNPGIARLASTVACDIRDTRALVRLAGEHQVDLVVVGPEQPLADGVADRLADAGRAVVGPTAAAAALETSKSFAKEFMSRHRVPTAAFRISDTPERARAAVDELGVPVVVKADGLAAGKGVTVAPDRASALEAIDAAMVRHAFGPAGSRLVIEECLEGPELSVFVLSDGERFASLGAAQDHKRVFDGDCGPNTGGMGAFAPSPLADEALRSTVVDRIVGPVLRGMAAEGRPFRGFLYAGLMLTTEGPQVIEFNVRLGDPEAQVVLPTLGHDLGDLFAAAAHGRLPDDTRPIVSSTPHVGVVLASGGYPGAFETGKRVSGIDRAEALDDVMVFHAGTAFRDGRLVTSGGRVLTVVGRGASFAAAATRAYQAADLIEFEGKHCRRDIGAKAQPARTGPR